MSFFKKLKKDVEQEEETGKNVENIEQKILEKNVPKKAKEKASKKSSSSKLKTVEKGKISLSASKKSSSDWLKAPGQLAVDVYQSDSDFCIQAPIGGIDPEDIDISVENEMLVLKGERKEPEAEKEKSYFYQECYWGPFSRQIILPEDIDLERTKAFLRKGILTIKIPKVKKVKKKTIAVEEEGF